MADPRLRILLVDQVLPRRLSIEKALNTLGYWRIAPVSSLEEMLNIIERAVMPFELLVINEAVLYESGINLQQLIHDYPVIKNSLAYKDEELPVLLACAPLSKKINFLASTVPTTNSLRQVMGHIDFSSLKSSVAS